MQKFVPGELPVEWIYVPDVCYRKASGVERRMQLIMPYDPSGKRYPLTVFVPGSAWHRQEMYNKLPTLSDLARKGTVVAAVQVRESDIAPFPAQVEDVQAAVAFLREHAEEFHIDSTRVHLMGDSSGGHIAVMAALMCPEMSLCGVVDLFGPTDILRSAQAAPKHLFPDGLPTEFLLGIRDIPAHPEAARRASCAMYITDRPLPPMLIVHGDADTIVSIAHSRELYRLLTEKGHTAELIEVTGAGHGGMAYWSGALLERIAAFLTGNARNCQSESLY